MATVTAKAKLDLGDYDPFGIFAEGGVSYSARSATKFKASLDDLDIVAKGTAFNTAGEPNSGFVTSMTVFKDNLVSCTFEGFAISTATVTAGNEDATLSAMLGGDDKITGSKKSDVLLGFGGSDKINGGLGNDTIDAGSGSDNKATGGGGKDSFLFTSASFVTITDFNAAQDRIKFDSDDFGMFDPGKLPAGFFNKGTEAEDDDDYLIYDKSSGKLYLDFDGDGILPKFLIAKLNGKPNLQAEDIFII